MAKTDDQLFVLIQALTKSEKRFFRRLSESSQGGDKNYMLVFDLLDQMDSYDEQELRHKIGDVAFAKSLHVTKNYLYNHILRALRLCYDEKDVTRQIHNLLFESQLLNEKGLFIQSQRLLNQALKKARTFHHLPLQLGILRRMVSFAVEQKNKHLREEVEEIYQQSECCLKQLQEEFSFQFLNHRMFIYIRTENRVRADNLKLQAAALLENPVIQNYQGNGSFYSQYLYHNIHGLYHMYNQEHQQANSCFEKVIRIWLDNKQMRKAHTSSFIIHLYNYLVSCLTVKDLEAFEKHLKIFQQIKVSSFSEEAEKFQNLYFIKLRKHMHKNEFQEALQLVEPIRIGMDKYKSKINKARERSFCYNISVLHLAVEEYEKGGFWLDKITHDNSSDPRLDIEMGAKILQFVFHFEMGNEPVLEYLLSNVTREFRRKGKDYRFEKILFSYFRKLYKTVESERPAIYEELKAELEAFKNEGNAIPIGYLEIMFWLNKKIGLPPE